MHTSCPPLNVKGLIPNTTSNEARSSNPMINQIAPNRGARRIWNKHHRNTGNMDRVADEAEVEGALGVVNPTNIMTIRILDRLPSRFLPISFTPNVGYEKDFPPLPARPMIALQPSQVTPQSTTVASFTKNNVSYCTIPINQPVVKGK